MAKMILILLIALTFEAIGVVLLSKGIKQIGEVRQVSVVEVFRVVREGVVNSSIWLGFFFEALFFVGLLLLMSKGEVSFVWPITSLSFVFTAIAAKFYLHERISSTRWMGICLIIVGAALVTWSEQKRKQGPSPPSQPAEASAKASL